MKIRVTRGHIDRGVRQSCWFCPVALAVREALGPGFTRVEVGSNRITVNGESWRTTDRVSDFVWDFDRALPVEPFEFDLEVEG